MDWNPDPNFDFNNMELTADDFSLLNADFGDFGQGTMPIYDTNFCESPQRNTYHPSQAFEPPSTPYQQPNTPQYSMTQVQESQGQTSARPMANTQVETIHGLDDVPFTRRSIASLQKDVDLAIASGLPDKEIRKYKARVKNAKRAQNIPSQDRVYYKRRSIEDLEKDRAAAKAAGADKKSMSKYHSRIRAAKEAQRSSDIPSAQIPKTSDQEIAERKKKESQDRDQRVLKAAAAEMKLSVGQFCKLPIEMKQAARARARANGGAPPLRRFSGNNRASRGAAAGLSSPQDHQSSRYEKNVAIPSTETATAHDATYTMPPMLLETANQTLANPQINLDVSPRGSNLAWPPQTSVRSSAHAAISSLAPDGNLGSQSREFRADSHDSPLNFNFQKSPSPNHSARNPKAISSPRNIARDSIPRGQSSEAGSSWKGISSSPGSVAGSSWKGISSSPGSGERGRSPRSSLSPYNSDRRATPRLSLGPSPLGMPMQSLESKDIEDKGTKRIGTGLEQTKHGPGPSRWEPASLRAASAVPGNIRSAPAYGVRRNNKATKTLLGRLGGGRVATPEAKSRQVKPTIMKRETDRRSRKSLENKAQAEMAAREKAKKKEWNKEQDRIRDAQKKLEDEMNKWEKEQAKLRETHRKKQEKLETKRLERDRKLKKAAKNKKERNEDERRENDRKRQAGAHKKKRVGIKKAHSSENRQTATKPSQSVAPKRK